MIIQDRLSYEIDGEVLIFNVPTASNCEALYSLIQAIKDGTPPAKVLALAANAAESYQVDPPSYKDTLPYAQMRLACLAELYKDCSALGEVKKK